VPIELTGTDRDVARAIEALEGVLGRETARGGLATGPAPEG